MKLHAQKHSETGSHGIDQKEKKEKKKRRSPEHKFFLRLFFHHSALLQCALNHTAHSSIQGQIQTENKIQRKNINIKFSQELTLLKSSFQETPLNRKLTGV